MSAGARLGLGTAQFGLAYGITNRSGHVGEREVGEILALCHEAGIETIDTAPLYGESEAAIGRALPAVMAARIVTKTAKFAGVDDGAEAARRVRETFAHSLHALGQPQVHALLVHDAADLLGRAGSSIWAAMEALRDAGHVRRIGVSVYDGLEIDRVLDRFPIEIVQLPYNPIDRRLSAGGQLAVLSRAGIEIHARSLFLQGLLLEPVKAIAARFAPVRDAVAQMDRAFAEHGLDRLEGILAFAFANPYISCFLCGVANAAQLRAIVLAAEKASGIQGLEIHPFTEVDEVFLNPSRWAEL